MFRVGTDGLEVEDLENVLRDRLLMEFADNETNMK